MFVDTNTTKLTPGIGGICSMARPRTYHLPRFRVRSVGRRRRRRRSEPPGAGAHPGLER